MNQSETNYKSWSNWYDLIYEIISPNDINFYETYINKNVKRVLEMGVGTGRIPNSFLHKNLKWTGVDISEDMLNVCKEKIKPKQPLSENLLLIQEDMTKIDIKVDNNSIYNLLFDLVIYPSHSLMSVGNIELQKKALCSGIKHLDKNGILIFDLHNPNNYVNNKEYMVFGEKEINSSLHKLYGKSSVDFDKKKHINYQKIEINSINKIELKSVDYFLYFEDIINICDELNIEIIDFFGDYDKSVLNEDSEEIILVCKKK
jgi:SAM-dependent methyltransferase